jgi:hypothetical protein
MNFMSQPIVSPGGNSTPPPAGGCFVRCLVSYRLGLCAVDKRKVCYFLVESQKEIDRLETWARIKVRLREMA